MVAEQSLSQCFTPSTSACSMDGAPDNFPRLWKCSHLAEMRCQWAPSDRWLTGNRSALFSDALPYDQHVSIPNSHCSGWVYTSCFHRSGNMWQVPACPPLFECEAIPLSLLVGIGCGLMTLYAAFFFQTCRKTVAKVQVLAP